MSKESVIHVHHARTKQLAASDFNHEEWNHAPPVTISRYWSGKDAPPTRHAEARLVWHEGGLCVRFVCRQHEPLVVSARPQTTQKVIGLWDRDVCEMFVAPRGGEPEAYFEFEAAPTGEWLDLAIHLTPGGRETNWEYSSGMSAHARVNVDEVMIGCCAVAGFQTPTTPARRALAREFLSLRRRGADRGYLAWQPTLTAQPDFHVPQVFGWLEFR
ncbi:MAG: carbohydrate-binding family 9-like protein [Pyrinomonadaceae bacterium]